MINEATKLNEYFITSKKYYNFNLNLLAATDSGDQTGQITKTKLYTRISETKIKTIVNLFNNCSYYQQVPIFSAVKLNGRRLYHYARKQIVVKPPNRYVTIHQLTLNHYNPFMQMLNLTAIVSKGTYIRALGVDLATCLNQYGYVSELKRTMLEHCQKLPIFVWNQKNDYEKYLIPVPLMLKQFNYRLWDSPIRKYQNHPQQIIHLPIKKAANYPPVVFIYDKIKQQIMIYHQRMNNEYRYQKLVRLDANHSS